MTAAAREAVVLEVPCAGTLKLTSLKPVAPGRGQAPRTVTIAEGRYGSIPAGEGRYLKLKLDASARYRIRSSKATRAVWQTYWADGSQQNLFVGHLLNVVNDAAR